MNQYSYAAAASLALLECVFPPIPSEVILPAAGALCLTTSMAPPGVIVSATLGAAAWNILLFVAGLRQAMLGRA